jgi:hypothetical protein
MCAAAPPINHLKISEKQTARIHNKFEFTPKGPCRWRARVKDTPRVARVSRFLVCRADLRRGGITFATPSELACDVLLLAD